MNSTARCFLAFLPTSLLSDVTKGSQLLPQVSDHTPSLVIPSSLPPPPQKCYSPDGTAENDRSRCSTYASRCVALIPEKKTWSMSVRRHCFPPTKKLAIDVKMKRHEGGFFKRSHFGIRIQKCAVSDSENGYIKTESLNCTEL